ncbi:AfsR/SARP family transcriptional regulator, partial [Kitasatospora griseola]|uniref:AfsR/SARP family transcriptional regulator n=1 Tax=Kitasatospora griseola TaxID=2064 RepID=UPI001E38CFD3
CAPCRAAANLRSALCQGRTAGSATVIDSIGQRLRLSPTVCVDLHERWEWARLIIGGLNELPYSCDELIDGLRPELLPGWPEEWLTLDRERWDLMRLHALESLAQQFQAAQWYVPALQTALAAIAIDPIRETAHRRVIEIHIAEGNPASAIKRYRDYQDFLRRELNVAPSSQMDELVGELTGVHPTPRA